MCPLLIMHGDKDTLVPYALSSDLSDRIVEIGLDEPPASYLITDSGHGTSEFFQPEVKALVLDFWQKYL